MSIVVTSNDGKNNSLRLGKITPDNLKYKTCLVRVLNASYRCTVWKFSKKADYAKFCSTSTLTGTGYTQHQVDRLNVASNRQRLILLNYTLPGLLSFIQLGCTANVNACMPMQGGSLYHFNYGL